MLYFLQTFPNDYFLKANQFSAQNLSLGNIELLIWAFVFWHLSSSLKLVRNHVRAGRGQTTSLKFEHARFCYAQLLQSAIGCFR